MLFLGLRLVEGALRAKKLKIQQIRIRQAIARVYPIVSAVRRHSFKIVRKYSVPCPNALWHIDGEHKLINHIGLLSMEELMGIRDLFS